MTDHSAMSRFARSFGLGIFVAAIGLLVYFGLFGFELEEDVGLALMIKARGERRVPDDVVVINLDKPMATALGSALEPDEWPRTVHARLVDRLASAGASVIVFDIFFREARGQVEDHALAQAIKRAGNVILFAFLRRDGTGLPVPGQAKGGSIDIEQLIAPTPGIASSAVGMAPFALPKGKIRVSQFWSFRRSAGDRPTLPAMALQLYTLDAYDDFLRLLGAGKPKAAASLPDAREAVLQNQNLARLMDTLKQLFVQSPGLAGMLLKRAASDPALAANSEHRRRLSAMIHLYGAGNLHYLNFYGPPHTVRTISYADVLHGDEAPPDLTGKVVFIGYSAAFQPDQKDGHYTVYSQPDGLDISGVEIAATAFANLLEQSTARPLPPLQFILIIIGYGLTAAMLARRTRALQSVGLSALLPATYATACLALFETHFLWLPVVVPVLIQSPVALLAGLGLGYWETGRERNRIRQAFGHYIPDEVVAQLLRGPDGPHAHHERRYGICLATDAERYTGLAESMAPDALQAYLNRYYAALFAPVRAHGGIVSDVIGDAMLAIWPASHNDVAVRAQACRAAVEIVHSVEAFNAGNELQLPTRIGLHAGEVVLGNIGALDHFEYRAVGDIVNTASRIQGVNKLLHTRVVVSHSVIDGVSGFATRELGRFQLAGKQQPVTLHELLGEVQSVDPKLQRMLERFAAGLTAYRDQAWTQALSVFAEILQAWPSDGPARFYYDLCQVHAARPPSQPWNPTILLKNK